jgi:hypothetical protein
VPLERIEEETRILTPPSIEECNHTPYEFKDTKELEEYLEYASNQSIDSLFGLVLELVTQFNDQDRHIQILMALDIVATYFQDKFPTVHYLLVLGENESGKTTVGNTFELAYRCVNMTNPSEANIFRALGTVESGQCTLVLDEFDRMSQMYSANINALLKTGYDHNKRVAKVNTNSLKQELFYAFCKKVLIGEKSPNENYARGVLDRTFSFTSVTGNPEVDIKETLEHQDDPRRKKQYDRLMGFRKLMLVYRLIHFKDPIPDIDIGVQRRSKELCKPYIQLFYGSESQRMIEETLEWFLKSKLDRKSNSIDNVALPLIINLVAELNGPIPNALLWQTITGSLDGEFFGSDEYHSVEYGKLYRDTLIQRIKDKFGPTPTRLHGGKRAYQFDLVKLQKIAKSYSSEVEIRTTLKGDTRDTNDTSLGSSSDSTREKSDIHDTNNTIYPYQSNQENYNNKEKKTIESENIGIVDSTKPSGEASQVSPVSPPSPSLEGLSREQKDALLREYDRLSALSRKKSKDAFAL